MELTKLELEEISRLIKEGYTSGRLDGEDEEGNSVFVAWEYKHNKISYNKWTDNDVPEDY